MTLRDFKSLLALHPGKGFQIHLPGGDTVPESFHVTEIGRVQKTFIDCGGTLREQEACVLQVWLGGDDDHRLAVGKLSGILAKASSFLTNEDIPLEFEYETTLISQYTVESAEASDAAVVLQLRQKHTDCLAKELCGLPPAPGVGSGKKSYFTGTPTCCGPSCC